MKGDKVMDNHQKRPLVPICSENIGTPDSFTIAMDAKTNQLYIYEEKQMKASVFLPLFFVFLVFTRLLSVEYIPLNSLITYSFLSILLFGICLYGGNIMRKKGIKNVQQANLSKEEWERYREKGRRFYLRQILLVCLMFILSIACFIFLFMYQAKWWLVGAILSSIVTGSLLPFLSKTRYLLYKNKLDVQLNKER